MYYKLKKGELKKIISKGFNKAGNIRALALKVGIPRSTLSAYHMEKYLIKKENLDKLNNFLNISFNEKIIEGKLPSNWKQIKAGKMGVEMKKKKGTYERQLKLCQKKGSKKIKLWHKKMKKENPYDYYSMQYSKFKRIGGYKFITKNNEKVRNLFEKEVADILKDNGIKYRYEPFIQIGKKCFFPDFVINNKIIIECTEWRGIDKAIKLRDKIKYLKKEYDVFVVIPKALKRYYEILNNHLLLGTDELMQVIDKSR